MADHYLDNKAVLPRSYVEHIEELNRWKVIWANTLTGVPSYGQTRRETIAQVQALRCAC